MISLKLIGELITDEEIKLLVEWRINVQTLWNETFKVTFEGTKEWIKNLNPNRRLFFIVEDGVLIGHAGYQKRSKKAVYIDNVIRGRGERKGQMKEAVLTLIKIARFFEKKDVYVKVLPTNEVALKFYRSLGFVEKKMVGKLQEMKYEHNN